MVEGNERPLLLTLPVGLKAHLAHELEARLVAALAALARVFSLATALQIGRKTPELGFRAREQRPHGPNRLAVVPFGEHAVGRDQRSARGAERSALALLLGLNHVSFHVRLTSVRVSPADLIDSRDIPE